MKSEFYIPAAIVVLAIMLMVVAYDNRDLTRRVLQLELQLEHILKTEEGIKP